MYAAAAAELTADAPWRTPEWFTVAGQRERIRRCLDVDAVEGFVITASGAIVGNLTLDEIRRDILQSADIGYWVAPGARRRGVATHAIGLAVGHAFGCLGLHRIHATVDTTIAPPRGHSRTTAFSGWGSSAGSRWSAGGGGTTTSTSSPRRTGWIRGAARIATGRAPSTSPVVKDREVLNLVWRHHPPGRRPAAARTLVAPIEPALRVAVRPGEPPPRRAERPAHPDV